MKNRNKLNIPNRNLPIQRTAPAPTTQPTNPGGKRPSVMIAVPAMEMVNAEFAQHLAMSAAQMVANVFWAAMSLVMPSLLGMLLGISVLIVLQIRHRVSRPAA